MREMDLDTSGLCFTRNWFRTRNLATFREFIKPEFAGRPIVYVEIGVFEGMSLCWMLQHVLSHPDSRAVGIDPWLMTSKLDSGAMEGVHQRALSNLSRWLYPIDDGHAVWKCALFRANSAEILRRMGGRQGFAGVRSLSVDLCMVDGNHWSLAVLDDCHQVHKLMRPGGLMLFDDVENDHDKGDDHVKKGIELWLAEKPAGVELAWKHRYMEAYRCR